MARLIGSTGSWLWWLAGLCCAAIFGSRSAAAEKKPMYGVRPRPEVVGAERPAGGLEDSAQWKSLCEAWREAEEAVSGKRGDYPFDRAGQQKVLAGMDKASAGIDALAAAGMLAAAEAELLKKDLALLRGRVQRVRPKEMEGATCYLTGPMFALDTSVQASAARLSERLPILEKLVAGGKVHRVAAGKALAGIERDLAVLADEKRLAQIGDEKARSEAAKTRDAVKAQVEKLRELLGKAE